MSASHWIEIDMLGGRWYVEVGRGRGAPAKVWVDSEMVRAKPWISRSSTGEGVEGSAVRSGEGPAATAPEGGGGGGDVDDDES